MSKKVKVYSRQKPTKRKKRTNKPNDDKDIIVDIRREIDRLPKVSKKQYMTNGRIDLFETCIVMNVIFSVPGGSALMVAGAFYSSFIIFISGIIILFEGIFAYVLFGVLPSLIRDLKLLKIRRNIAKQ